MTTAEVLQEDKFRRDFMKEFSRQFPHYPLSYIESHQTTPGIPDLSWFDPAVGDLWLELKVVKAPRNIVTVRTTQVVWHRKRYEAGGKSWFATMDTNGDILLTPGHVAVALSPPVAGWRDVSRPYRMSALGALIGAMR